jgi:DNA modification methylase
MNAMTAQQRTALWQIREGDCRDVLRTLPEQSVQTCVTSPPYFGLRDYGAAGQRGAEATPDEFVAALVEDFRQVRRVLRDDGTVWLNLGDSYASSPPGIQSGARYRTSTLKGNAPGLSSDGRLALETAGKLDTSRLPGVKQKDLIGIPWMVAFALRADGWYLRSEIIWHKPNPMPESVTDRPTRAHEQVLLLSKQPRYFYDADAIAEPAIGQNAHDLTGPARAGVPGQSDQRGSREWRVEKEADDGNVAEFVATPTRNRRDVWTVATQPYAGAHFATFPPKLIEPCILAGSREGDTVLDPFAGAGTTGLVALRHGRSFVGCELSPEYADLARRRIIDDAPLLNSVSEAA